MAVPDRPQIGLDPLTAISPLDGRYRTELEPLAALTSEMALMQARVEIEARYLVALSKAGLVRRLNDREQTHLLGMADNFTHAQAERIKDIEEGRGGRKPLRHDVRSVEQFMREELAGTSLADTTEMLHFAITSEDDNNLSYRLMIERARREVCVPTLDRVITELLDRAKQYKNIPMLGRTHGQDAVPTTLGKEFGVFAYRLNGEVRTFASLPLRGKFNGAVGNFNAQRFAAPEIDWWSFSEDFVRSLGLEPTLISTQINPYEDVISIFDVLVRANGVILDLNQDMWRYISDDWLVQEVVEGETGSSTMTQKINPIYFEKSEGNVQLANSLLQGMGRKLAVSRLQRDLSDSTTIRNIGSGFGYSVLAYQNTLEGLSRVTPDEAQMLVDLLANWAILGEGAQTLLRRHGISDAYDIVAKGTKGVRLDAKGWAALVDSLPVNDDVRKRLHTLTPQTYIGDAVTLTDYAIAQINASRIN